MLCMPCKALQKDFPNRLQRIPKNSAYDGFPCNAVHALQGLAKGFRNRLQSVLKNSLEHSLGRMSLQCPVMHCNPMEMPCNALHTLQCLATWIPSDYKGFQRTPLKSSSGFWGIALQCTVIPCMPRKALQKDLAKIWGLFFELLSGPWDSTISAISWRLSKILFRFL